MDTKCLLCNQEITEQNCSYEHIFLHSFGYNIGSYNLLCKRCNNELGELVDYKCEKSFEPFLTVSGRSKERYLHGEVEFEDGTKIPIKFNSNSEVMEHPVKTKDRLYTDKNNKNFAKEYAKKHPETRTSYARFPSKVNSKFKLNMGYCALEALKMGIEFSYFHEFSTKEMETKTYNSFIIIVDILKKSKSGKGNPILRRYKQKGISIPILFLLHQRINLIQNFGTTFSNDIYVALYPFSGKTYCFVSLFGILKYKFPVLSFPIKSKKVFDGKKERAQTKPH